MTITVTESEYLGLLRGSITEGIALGKLRMSDTKAEVRLYDGSGGRDAEKLLALADEPVTETTS